MGNAIIGLDNHALTGALIAGREAPGLGVNLLQDQHGCPASAWQTPAGVTRAVDGAFVTMDTNDQSSQWRLFMLAGTNLTSAAQIRWRVGTPEGLIAPPTPPLDIDFLAGEDFTAPAAGTTTFTRSTVAWRCKSDGTWEEKAAGVARVHHHPLTGARRGLMIEATGTNRVRNPRAEGLGYPSTAPTNMAAVTANGLSVEWLGWETLDGLPGFYVRVFGTTAGGTGTARIYFETATGIAATTAQNQNVSMFLYAAADYVGNISIATATVGWLNLDNVGATLTDQSATVSIGAVRPGASRVFCRLAANGGATQTNLRPYLQLAVPVSNTVDTALWIACPQAETNQTVFSSPMFPPVGAPAAFTRGAETLVYTPPAGTILTSGTFYAAWASGNDPDFIHPGGQLGGVALQVDNGTNNERFLLRTSTVFHGPPVSVGSFTTDFLVSAGGSTTYDSPFLTPSVARAVAEYTGVDPFRAAFAYTPAPATLRAAYMTDLLDPAYAGAMPAGLTRMQAISNVNPGPVCMVRWRYYSVALSPNQLQGLTTSQQPLSVSPADVSYDSGWRTLVSPGYAQAIVIPPAMVEGRVARLDIDDPTNPDGFVNVPLVYAGVGWQPENNITWDTAILSRAEQEVITTRSGADHVQPLFRRRGWTIGMQHLTALDAASYARYLDFISVSGVNAVFVPDPDSANLQREAVMGPVEPISGFTFGVQTVALRSWRARIMERL